MADLFIITSTIHVIRSKGWSYIHLRSDFTDEERYTQTLQTIESVRKKVPSAKILLIEGSKLHSHEETQFIQKVDFFVDGSASSWVKEGIDSLQKGMGEIRQLLFALRYCEANNIFKQFQIKRIFKLSGRYWLKDTFDIEIFSADKNTFISNSPNILGTVCYSIPIGHLEYFKSVLHKCDEIYSKQISDGVEILFFKILKENLVIVPKIHCCGYVAISKNEFYEV